MSRPSKSTRWTREHGTKVVHSAYWTALLHALELNIKFARLVRRDGKFWWPYPCRWGQWYLEGERFPRHWHAGRSGKYRRGRK